MTRALPPLRVVPLDRWPALACAWSHRRQAPVLGMSWPPTIFRRSVQGRPLYSFPQGARKDGSPPAPVEVEQVAVPHKKNKTMRSTGMTMSKFGYPIGPREWGQRAAMKKRNEILALYAGAVQLDLGL